MKKVRAAVNSLSHKAQGRNQTAMAASAEKKGTRPDLRPGRKQAKVGGCCLPESLTFLAANACFALERGDTHKAMVCFAKTWTTGCRTMNVGDRKTRNAVFGHEDSLCKRQKSPRYRTGFVLQKSGLAKTFFAQTAFFSSKREPSTPSRLPWNRKEVRI